MYKDHGRPCWSSYALTSKPHSLCATMQTLSSQEQDKPPLDTSNIKER
ncbi:predicted protein [Sclerotinia sclerotiorum 1980 UF-70]|uniref:Uncharacterized protein n=1 Tax=Sclerotinia sclerotiorum (strain ATCC 18683 / 1980 / Ss-1) TaxID=665079 RepID=A7ECB3_SCLS1|nr:predicted protein [Sclerotinia sclerotiorum 1980 UF-70]EDO00092.1 predicted protein [Sclerotinia sclerotiorum 1980 UF-70]